MSETSEHNAEYEAAKRAWLEMDARHCSVILDYEDGIKEAIDLLNTPGGAGEALAVLTALIDGRDDA